MRSDCSHRLLDARAIAINPIRGIAFLGPNVLGMAEYSQL